MSVWSALIGELRNATQAAVPTTAADALVFETPPDPAMGDIAVPCFALSKMLKQPPGEIAGRIVEVLTGHPLVAKAEAVGAYCNITLDGAEVARRVLSERSAGLYTLPSSGRADIKSAPTQPSEKPEEIVLEFVSPNTNKPLHLGHLRNAFFGEAVGRILEAVGHRVHRVMLLNDRGIAMAKAMLAYARWGQGTTPESEHIKGDHFVGGWYVRFEQESAKQRPTPSISPSPHYGGLRSRREGEEGDGMPQPRQVTPLDREAQELVQKWEAGDAETRALWERMCGWAMVGQQETLAAIGIAFEKTYRESEIVERGRAIVHAALDAGVFTKDAKGNIIARLPRTYDDGGPTNGADATDDVERYDFTDKVLMRADGTTVYATQDLALVEAKAKDYPDARSIVVTAVEQDYYFKQFNAILEMLADGSVVGAGRRPRPSGDHPSTSLRVNSGSPLRSIEHLSYEMVHLPEGRMKSREGTVVDADDLLAKLEEMAAAEIAARADAVPGEPAAGTDEPAIFGAHAPGLDNGQDRQSEGEAIGNIRARDIALAAIRFYLLHANPRTVLTFNPKEQLAFTGKTGPYLQYAHARMCAIMRRAEVSTPSNSPSRRGGGQDGSPPHLEGGRGGVELLVHDAEKQLLLRIARFPDVIAEAAVQRDPSNVAQFAYDFAQTFADFYRDCPVLSADTDGLRDTRLALVTACRSTLAQALTILGIVPLEEM